MDNGGNTNKTLLSNESGKYLTSRTSTASKSIVVRSILLEVVNSKVLIILRPKEDEGGSRSGHGGGDPSQGNFMYNRLRGVLSC